jgi:hypothetical protein
MSAGRGGVAYAWSWNGDVLRVTTRGVSVFRAPCPRVEYVEADARDDRRLRLLADCGVFDSLDRGSSWRRVGEPVAGPRTREPQFRSFASVVALAPEPPGRMLFAIGYDYDQPLFHTDDAGRTWTLATSGRKSDVFFEDNGRTAWALSFPTLERSTDGGRTFARATDLVPKTPANGRPVRRIRGPAAARGLQLTVDDGTRSYLASVDKQTLAVTLRPLPLESRECGPASGIPSGCKGGEIAELGTFIPGEAAAICLGLIRESGWDGVDNVAP